jgi:hypothetical protein
MAMSIVSAIAGVAKTAARARDAKYRNSIIFPSHELVLILCFYGASDVPAAFVYNETV